ncbi:hypothetical protein DIPPA_29252 [Diplonema papillatum]|nr:hypothetical protein DIPPA_29252 [Diplonema papillatum]
MAQHTSPHAGRPGAPGAVRPRDRRREPQLAPRAEKQAPGRLLVPVIAPAAAGLRGSGAASSQAGGVSPADSARGGSSPFAFPSGGPAAACGVDPQTVVILYYQDFKRSLRSAHAHPTLQTSLLSPDVTITTPSHAADGPVPYAGTYTGALGAHAFFNKFRDAYSAVHSLDVSDVAVAGLTVYAKAAMEATTAATGITVSCTDVVCAKLNPATGKIAVLTMYGEAAKIEAAFRQDASSKEQTVRGSTGGVDSGTPNWHGDRLTVPNQHQQQQQQQQHHQRPSRPPAANLSGASSTQSRGSAAPPAVYSSGFSQGSQPHAPRPLSIPPATTLAQLVSQQRAGAPAATTPRENSFDTRSVPSECSAMPPLEDVNASFSDGVGSEAAAPAARRRRGAAVVVRQRRVSGSKPCRHNEWDNVRIKRGEIMLRCRVCQEQWRAPASRERCQNFQRAACADEACELLHVHAHKQSLWARVNQFGNNVLDHVPVRQRNPPLGE